MIMSCFTDDGFVEVHLSQGSIVEITHKPIKDEMPNLGIWHFRHSSKEKKGILWYKINF